MATHYIGTSGWSYDHWVGPFYPEGLQDDERLAHYAERLDCVEINNSFYNLPSEQTLDHWRETAPKAFRFAVKASRYITHMKKLKDPDAGLGNFLPRIERLGDRLGPILFQLPPNWHFNAERLEQFLTALPDDHRYTLELRDRTWINDDALALLSDHDVAFCIYELDGFLSPQAVTTDFVYVRLHGPDGAYKGNYDDETLAGWAEQIRAWRDDGRDCWCFFDNDEAGHAARNALSLRRLLDGEE